MRIRVSKLALIVLQGSLGLIVIAKAAFLAFVPAQVKAFPKTGLPDWYDCCWHGVNCSQHLCF